jgi:hypothetical protein
MTTHDGGEERSAEGDHPSEKVTLSLPPEFFSIIADEFEKVQQLMESQQAILLAAERARREEAESGESDSRGNSNDEEGVGDDALDRLVMSLLGKSLTHLHEERLELHRQTRGATSTDLYRAAELIGEQAQHQLNRLAIAFDLIAGDPVRRELARRTIKKSSSARRKQE